MAGEYVDADYAFGCESGCEGCEEGEEGDGKVHFGHGQGTEGITFGKHAIEAQDDARWIVQGARRRLAMITIMISARAVTDMAVEKVCSFIHDKSDPTSPCRSEICKLYQLQLLIYRR